MDEEQKAQEGEELPEETPKTEDESEAEKTPPKKKWSVKKRLLVISLSVLLFVGAVLGSLQLGVVHAQKSWKQWYPSYAKVDLLPVLQKSALSEEDYALVYAQTGLTKIAVDDLLDSRGIARILTIQDFYMQKRKVKTERFNPFTYSESIDDFAPTAILQDGDIVVTSTTYVSGFRLGHAALVVNGQARTILEAFGPGDESGLHSVDTFTCLADFMVLRPKLDEDLRTKVAAYARENMVGAKYRFSIGLLSKKFPKKFEKTQCAHVPWYAYKKFGVDLDSNGGLVVTPPEIFRSKKIELVQVFGFHPKKLWY